MAICHSHLDLQDIQEGSSVRNFSLSPTFPGARLHEPSGVEHSSARSKISLPDDKSSLLSAHNQTSTSTLTKRHSRAVEFEPVTHIIVLPDAEKGKPRVQLRRMSMSLSFSKAPSEESLDDPSFIPTSPRRICVRVPSLTRSHTRSNSIDRQSNNQHLRSCLAHSIDSSGSGWTRLDHQNTGHVKSFISPKTSPISPRGRVPSSPIAMSSSAPSHESSMLSGFISRPRPNRSSSTSSSSLAGRPSSHLDDPTEALRACCLACYCGTELGLQGEWEDAPWSSGAKKKKRKDDDEREKKEAERKRIGEKYGKLSPLLPGGLMDEVDWENSGMFNRFGTDVVVDEVTLTQRDPADRSSGKDGPVGLNHSVALLRLDHSPSSSPQADESPLLSPSQMRGDLSMPSVSPPWMPNTKSPRIDKPAAYDGMPSSEANSSFFPDFHSSSIFGGAIVKAPSPIETPELCPSSTTPNTGLDSGSIPTTHSHPSSSSTDSHLDHTSPPPSSPTLPLLQTPSIGPSSSASPVSCPIPTTTAPPLAKRFLSGFSFGGINKVFKHSTKEAGASHGFF